MMQRLNFSTATLLILLSLILSSPISANWRYVGPDGGPAVELMIDLADSDRLLHSSTTAGLFESSDGGMRFDGLPGTPRSSTEFRSALKLERIVQSPVSTDLVFGAAPSSSDSIWRSTDGGRSWNDVAVINSTGGSAQGDVAFNSDGSVVYALSHSGLHVSNDEGVNWRLLTLTGAPEGFPRFRTHIVTSPTDSSRVYLHHSSGIIRSDDAGESWQSLSALPVGQFNEFTIRAGIVETLYAFTGRDRGEVFSSADDGATWTALGAGLVDPDGLLADLTELTVQPTTGVIFALSEGRIHRSADGGQTWTSSTLPASIDVPGTLRFDQGDADRLFILASSGLFVSEDGGTSWDLRSEGFRGHVVERMAKNRADAETVYADTSHTVLATREKGANWTEIRPLSLKINGLSQPVASAANPSVLVAVSADLLPLRSIDGGASWSELTPPSPFIAGLTTLIWSDPRDDQRLVAADFGPPSIFDLIGLYQSTDAGGAWTRVFDPPADRQWFQPYSLADDPTRPGTVFFGVLSSSGPLFTDGLILRSTDGGSTFDVVFDEISFPKIAVDSAGTAFVGGFRDSKRQGIWRSTDGGDTWTQANSGIPAGSAIFDLAAHPEAPGILVASTAIELFVSIDSGLSWQPLSLEGLGTGNAVRSAEILSGSGTALELMIGTSQGVYYTPQATIFRVEPLPVPIGGAKMMLVFTLLMLVVALIAGRRPPA